MGAVIGFLLAAQPAAPVRKLVVNDAGPFISKEALAWLGTFIGADPTFDSIEALEQTIRTNSAGFGPLTDAQWRTMTLYLSHPKPGGGYGYAYDPRIGEPYKQDLPDIDLWPFWDRVACPTLILRGEHSNVLARSDAEAMTKRGPKPDLIEFAGVGHAPALMTENQIAVVRNFLLG